MTPEATRPAALERLTAERDAAYAVMRQQVPELAVGAVDPERLSLNQLNAVVDFERLDAQVRKARAAWYTQSHPDTAAPGPTTT